MIRQIEKNLFLITLDPPIPGFDNFISAWLYTGKPSFLVDVGPAVTVNQLLKALKDLHVSKPDYIFLTHIHFDHAGGIGDVSSHFPDTPIICHQKGISHLCDPNLLWKSTIKVLGKTGEAYGPMKPVLLERIIGAETFSSDAVIPIMTPGHSAHHVSFLAGKYLFAGEAGGVHLSLLTKKYLRPATPPSFFLDVFLESIDTLIALNPSTICYGHFGIASNPVEMLKKQKNQLLFWKKIMENEMRNIQDDNFFDMCMARLLKEDPLIQGYHAMDEPMKIRETGFLINSIKGFVGYLNKKSNSSGNNS